MNKCLVSASCWVIAGVISALQSPARAEPDVIKESLPAIPSTQGATWVAAEGTFPAIAPTVQWNNRKTAIDSTTPFMVVDAPLSLSRPARLSKN